MSDDNKTTPTPAPGLDLDAAEKRVDGFRGRFRVMAYDSGDELLEFVALDAYNCDESEIDGGDVDEIAQFACDDETQRAIVNTLNEAPTLIAEIRALRAEAARITAAGDIEAKSWEAMSAEIARLTAELAAARAVPGDVEAAIGDLITVTANIAMHQEHSGICGEPRDVDADDATVQHYADTLRTAIARAISDATAAAVGEFIDDHAKRLCEQAGESWELERTKPGCWPAAVREVLDMLVATPGGLIIDGRSRQAERAAARGTVGGLLATAGLHPDGCHSADVMAARDCDADGHMSCPTCTRNARGPLPKGG